MSKVGKRTSAGIYGWHNFVRGVNGWRMLTREGTTVETPRASRVGSSRLDLSVVDTRARQCVLVMYAHSFARSTHLMHRSQVTPVKSTKPGWFQKLAVLP